MTTTELYARQEPLNLKTISRAAVVGCGGTGAWTAIFLAMSGVPHLILIDPDFVEESNLNRLPFTVRAIDGTKTSEVRNFVTTVRPNILCERHSYAIDEYNIANLLHEATHVFCCTDNLNSQRLIYAYCQTHHISYCRIGYDGTTLNVGKAFPLSFDEETPEEVGEGYRVTPSWVVPAAFAAAAGVFSEMRHPIELYDEMGTVHCQGTAYIPAPIQEMLLEKGREDVIESPGEYLDSWGYCNDCAQCGECSDRCPGHSECSHVSDSYSEGVDQGREDTEADVIRACQRQSLGSLSDSVADAIADYTEFIVGNNEATIIGHLNRDNLNSHALNADLVVAIEEYVERKVYAATHPEEVEVQI